MLPFTGHFTHKNKVSNIKRFFRSFPIFFCVPMVVCLFQTPPCYAVAPMGEIIQKMQKTYDGIRNFKAGFLQETYIRSAKRTFIEEGAVFLENLKTFCGTIENRK